MHFGHESRAVTMLFLNEIIPPAIPYHSSPIQGSSRGRFGQNNCPRGRNFYLNWAQGEVGVSPPPQKKKKKKNVFFFLQNFHQVIPQTSCNDNLVPLQLINLSI